MIVKTENSPSPNNWSWGNALAIYWNRFSPTKTGSIELLQSPPNIFLTILNTENKKFHHLTWSLISNHPEVFKGKNGSLSDRVPGINEIESRAIWRR